MNTNEQICDAGLNAVVGGRTEVTREQYEQILAQRAAEQKQSQSKPWWQFW